VQPRVCEFRIDVASAGHTEIARLLVEANSDVNAVDDVSIVLRLCISQTLDALVFLGDSPAGHL
jgi:Ankyrin repeat